MGGLTVDCNNRTHEGVLQSEAPFSAQRWYASGAVFMQLRKRGHPVVPVRMVEMQHEKRKMRHVSGYSTCTGTRVTTLVCTKSTPKIGRGNSCFRVHRMPRALSLTPHRPRLCSCPLTLSVRRTQF